MLFHDNPQSSRPFYTFEADTSVREMMRACVDLAEKAPITCEFKGVTFDIPAGSSAMKILRIFKGQEFDTFAAHYSELFITLNPQFYSRIGLTLNDLSVQNPRLLSRVIDIGCGTGFVGKALCASPTLLKADPNPLRIDDKRDFGRECGYYVGIDPSHASIDILLSWLQAGASLNTLEYSLISRSAELVLDPKFRKDLIERIGGHASLLTMNASLHQIAKSFSARDGTVTEFFNGCADLCEPGTLFVIGNYYHLSDDRDGQESSSKTYSDFENFGKNFKEAFASRWKALTGRNPITHEPTPPEQLFPPALMGRILSGSGFEVISVERFLSNPALGTEGHPGIRAYVMIAKKT